jgi:cysteine desulfurase
VLRALGLDDELAQSSIRFGLGRFNTADEVDQVAARVVAEVRRLRSLSPGYAAALRRRNASAEKGLA